MNHSICLTLFLMVLALLPPVIAVYLEKGAVVHLDVCGAVCKIRSMLDAKANSVVVRPVPEETIVLCTGQECIVYRK